MAQQLTYARRDQMDASIERAFMAQEQARQLGMWLKLAAGIPASFFAPFLIASLAFNAALRFGVLLNFWQMFALLAGVLVPLIYWRANLHRTDFFLDAAADQGVRTTEAYRADSSGEMDLRRSVLSWGACQELFFWGPYLVLEARTTWRADQSAVLANRERAIHIVRELLAQEAGVASSTLRQREESDAQFGQAMRYLNRYDWIDVSRRRDRVWLLSDARQRLAVVGP